MANRELKFRVWDKFNECFWYSEKRESLRAFFDMLHDLSGNDLGPIQEWIGLKDKNGKDIYEGDKTIHGEVVFYTNLVWDGCGSKHPGFYFKTTEYDDTVEMKWNEGFDKNIEVIGNIYENG